MIAMEKTLVSDAKFSAMRTYLGSVFWRDVHKAMSVPDCLILNKLFQLEPAPIRNDSIKYSSPISFSYSCQVLHNKEASDLLRFYDLLAYDMVHVSGKPFLSAFQSFEMPLGRFSAFTLEPCFKTSEPINLRFDISKELSIRSYGNLVYAEINTNNIFDRANVDADLSGNSKVEVEISVPHKKFAFSELPVSILGEVCWNFNLGFGPSFDCADAQNIVFDREASWWVVPDASIESGFGPCYLATLMCSLDSSCNELGLEMRKLSSHFSVNSIVELEIGSVSFPTDADCIVYSIRISGKSLPDKRIVFNLNLDYGSVFHKSMEEEQVFKNIGNEEDATLLIHIHPTTKASGLPVANSL